MIAGQKEHATQVCSSLGAGSQTQENASLRSQRKADEMRPADVVGIALLTGGGDKPYALGLAQALTLHGILLDFIGSDDLKVPELLSNPGVNFLNLRGNQCQKASPAAKILRVFSYYIRLVRYAATARPKLFHILWHNKCLFFDRTVLLTYYKLLGKKIIFTAHNVNARKRDSNDSWSNRFSLGMEYRLVDHIFVHTEQMRRELRNNFAVPDRKISVIPFGINSTVPTTDLTAAEAKQRLGLTIHHKTMLFFGNIAPYKGLEFLVDALKLLARERSDYRLIIAGRPKDCASYWNNIQRQIEQADLGNLVIERIEYVPDEETEIFFKAADVLVLPYTRIFQSGVLFLGYNFGLPAIAADVGSLKEEIIEGKTGFAFKSRDSSDLAKTIERFFVSELFGELEKRRMEIRHYAQERYSWDKVATATTKVYSKLLAT